MLRYQTSLPENQAITGPDFLRKYGFYPSDLQQALDELAADDLLETLTDWIGNNPDFRGGLCFRHPLTDEIVLIMFDQRGKPKSFGFGKIQEEH